MAEEILSPYTVDQIYCTSNPAAALFVWSQDLIQEVKNQNGGSLPALPQKPAETWEEPAFTREEKRKLLKRKEDLLRRQRELLGVPQQNALPFHRH